MCKHKLLKSMQILSGCKLSACEEELIFSLLVLDLFPCELGKVYYGFRISFHKEVTCLRKDRTLWHSHCSTVLILQNLFP